MENITGGERIHDIYREGWHMADLAFKIHRTSKLP